MANNRQWRATIKGTDYDIVFKPGVWTGKHKLIINGETVNLPRKVFAAFTGMDVPVQIGPKKARFVLVENKADIAIKGVFLGSGEPYTPLTPIEWWVWIFVVVCAVPIIILGGGSLAAVFGVLGVIFCLRIARSHSMKPLRKAFALLGVTLLIWVAYLALVMYLLSRLT
ncbi:MAG: hypothetical protein AAGU77_06500 [Bacillota bacterium]